MKITLVIALITIVIGMVWIRTFLGTFKAYEKGELYADSGDLVNAITFYDRAIRWYTPFNPYVQKSAQRLWEIGLAAERRGDTMMALMAFRTIRRAFYAASGINIAGKDWIEKCDSKLALLSEKGNKGSGLAIQGHRSMNTDAPGPHRAWSAIVTCTFLGWLGSAVGFIVFGMNHSGQVNAVWHRKRFWCVSTVVFFMAWVIAMIKA